MKNFYNKENRRGRYRAFTISSAASSTAFPQCCSRRFSFKQKGITQIDYIIAIGAFILVFALVLQYVSSYFSTIGDTINIRLMNSQATSLLDVAERGFEPPNWPQQVDNDSSILLLMHLDNSTLDSSQFGNNGTLSAANCSAAVIGKLDSGCSFNGRANSINISNVVVTNQSDFTYSVWVKPTNAGDATQAILSPKMGGSNYCLALLYTISNGNLQITNNGGSPTILSYNAGVLQNWTHIAVTHSFTNNISFLYINGVNVKNDSSSFCKQPVSSLFMIGRLPWDGFSNDFNGSIDEVEVWNRSLAAAEVYNLWAYENLLDRIGLTTRAYRFYVIVNNTQPYWRNQSLPFEDINNELVVFNYTDIGVGANVPSTAIYEANGSSVGYQINGNKITFRTSIATGNVKYFAVYFDDDSNFAEQSQTITGVDNLTETLTWTQPISVLQYRKLIFLNNSNYTRVKNSTQLPRDFSIRLIDTVTSATILNFGPPPPPSGNVISYERYALYQNSTSSVQRGRLAVEVW